MKKISLLSLFILFFSVVIIAQPKISWEKTKVDMGTFKEEAGNQSTVFNFSNTGDQPLILKSVKASCGCTSTSYSQEAILPGAKGFVNVTYDPKNRPGAFSKTISVTSNTERPTTILVIEGVVIPREKTIVDLYPREFGDLRLKNTAISLSKTLNTQVKVDSIEVVNTGQEDILLEFENVPPALKVTAVPKTLKAGKEGRGDKGYIIVEYDASKKKDWGILTDRFNVIINGVKHNQHRISVNADIVEDFSHLSEEEIANAPSIIFENSKYDFGTIKQGEKASNNYIFSNKGKTDLVIRKIKTSCGCTASNPEKMIIKPGESSHITVTFNSSGKSGKQQKTITVITNDPKNSSIGLQILGVVETSKTN